MITRGKKVRLSDCIIDRQFSENMISFAYDSKEEGDKNGQYNDDFDSNRNMCYSNVDNPCD